MKKGILTGSFDPPTIGHLDLIERSLKLFDELYVVILINPEKSYQFSTSERIEQLQAMTKKFDGVRVTEYDGLAIDFASSIGGGVFVRGVRNPKDFAYESEMAEWNFNNGGYDTVFLPASKSVENVSSTAAKEMLEKGDTAMLTDNVARLIEEGGRKRG